MSVLSIIKVAQFSVKPVVSISAIGSGDTTIEMYNKLSQVAVTIVSVYVPLAE